MNSGQYLRLLVYAFRQALDLKTPPSAFVIKTTGFNATEIMNDFPAGKLIHIWRNPVNTYLSRKKHAKRSANPPVFTVWFAPVPIQSLGREILIPVAAAGTLKGKTFTAFATTAAIAGRPFNAQSLASR